SVERERFLDITDFERDVVDTDGARLLVLRHDRPPIRPRFYCARYGPAGPAAQSHQGIVTWLVSAAPLASPAPPAVIALGERVAQRLRMRGGRCRQSRLEGSGQAQDAAQTSPVAALHRAGAAIFNLV